MVVHLGCGWKTLSRYGERRRLSLVPLPLPLRHCSAPSRRPPQPGSSLSWMALPPSSQVIILMDALDEGDPPEQQRPGYTGGIMACANKALMLVINCLAVKLPPNVRWVT